MSQVCVPRIYIICLVGNEKMFQKCGQQHCGVRFLLKHNLSPQKRQVIRRGCEVISSTYRARVSLFSLCFLKAEPWPNPFNRKVRGSKSKSERRNNIWLVGKQSTWSWSFLTDPTSHWKYGSEESWDWKHRAKFLLLHFEDFLPSVDDLQLLIDKSFKFANWGALN